VSPEPPVDAPVPLDEPLGIAGALALDPPDGGAANPDPVEGGVPEGGAGDGDGFGAGDGFGDGDGDGAGLGAGLGFGAGEKAVTGSARALDEAGVSAVPPP
jgi:hypothetical protein